MSETHWEERLKRIEEKIEQLPTREDLDALIHVQEVAASSLEEKTYQVGDQAESGYVVLESLFKGLEDRVVNLIQESEQRLTQRMDRMDENILQMGQVLEMVATLNQKQDERLSRLEESVSRLEESVSRMEESISGLTDITRAWIYKGNLIEKEVQELKKRMGDE
jgi:chromosome segregation ATPase